MPSPREDAAFERELVMTRGALLMVAHGDSPAMTVGGLAHGREVLDALLDEARREGVELVPLDRSDGRGVDIRARRPGTGSAVTR